MNTRCATCAAPLSPPTGRSPDVRYCQDDWWAEQLRRFDSGDPIDEFVADWFTAPPREKPIGGEWRSIRYRGTA